MGWFHRRSFRIGPLRLAKRGIGASVGVKGARIGGDARGQAVRGGRAPRPLLPGTPGREGAKPGGRRDRTGPGGATSSPASPGWRVLVINALLVGIILGVAVARPGEPARVDLFDSKGRRTGYAVVDRDTGRVDFYDAMSRRTGYGRVDGAGRVERFGVDGKRQEPTVVPFVPRSGRTR